MHFSIYKNTVSNNANKFEIELRLCQTCAELGRKKEKSSQKMGRKRQEKAAMDSEPEPPDSGWAWMVLCGAFVAHFVTVGFIASASVYVYVWISFFDGSAAETSLIISLCSFLMGALSPISGAMCKRFGPRVTAMVGNTMTCVGLAVSSQATGTIFLIISLGFFTAFGMSMNINATYTSLGMYFKKRLALALGLATAGTSLGQLALPPLYQYLIDQYGWRGSMLITSALAFHAVAASALIRPLRPQGQKRSSKESKVEGTTSHAAGSSTEVASTSLSFLNPSIFGSEGFVCSPVGTPLGEGSIFQGEPDVAMVIDETEDEDWIDSVDSDSWSLSSSSDGHMTAMNNNDWIPVALTALEHLPKRKRSLFIPGRKPRSGSMLSQTLFKQSSELTRLLRNPRYVVLLVIAIAHGFGWASTTYHLVSRAESINIEPDNAALLVTIMGAGSLIGRLGMGWIVDKNWVGPELYYTLSFGICALATFITPLITEFMMLVALALVHGLSFGCATVVIIMTPRVVVKPSLASTSTAYFLLAWGVGEISGGALAGWFYDVFKSYDYSFYAAGSMMTAASGLMLIIYFLQRAKRRHQLGLHLKPLEEQAGPVQPPSNQFDPELAESKHDDLGRVNPVFFMRQGFKAGIDQIEVERMGESVPVSEVDAELASQSCQTNTACNLEGIRINLKGKMAMGSLEEGCNGSAESPSIASSVNENHFVDTHANLSTQNDIDAEVHEEEIYENDMPPSVTDPSSQFPNNVSSGNSDTFEGDEEGVMGFENPQYEGWSHASVQESEKVERDSSSRDGCNVVSESGSNLEETGIENQLYFAHSNFSESLYDPECVKSESWDSESWDGAADNTGKCTEREAGMPEANHRSEIAHDSVDDQEQSRDFEHSDEDEHCNVQTSQKITSNYCGFSNPCYILGNSVDGTPSSEPGDLECGLEGLKYEAPKNKGGQRGAEISRGVKGQYIITAEVFL